LDQFDALRVLVVNDVKGIDISYLACITSLEFLSLGDADGTAVLDKLVLLKHLRFTANKRLELPKMGLPELRELAIWRFNDPDLAILAHYPKIESLEIIQPKKLCSLIGIEACARLEKLVLAYCPKLQDIELLSKAVNLRNLDLENTKAVRSYLAIGKLLNLEKLIIDKSASLINLDFTIALKRLEHLVIRTTPIESCDLSPLLLLPMLSHIYMDSKREYQPTLKKLEELVSSRK